MTMGKELQKAGMDYVVMKGQEVGRYYHELLSLRQSGDIDAWITNKGRKEVVTYAESMGCCGASIHQHVHFHLFEDTEVELHYIPAELHCPWYDRNLMRFFRSQMKHFAMDEGGYRVPTIEFDLLH